MQLLEIKIPENTKRFTGKYLKSFCIDMTISGADVRNRTADLLITN